MTLIVVIILFAATALGDMFPVMPVVVSTAGGWRIGLSLTLLGMVAAGAFVLLRLCARRMEGAGGLASMALGDRIMTVGQVGVAVVHVVNVALLGEAHAIKELLGDYVGVDEILCVLPPLLALLVIWAGHAPIDRRVTEALFLRRLDELKTPHAPLTTRQYVMMHVRHEAAIIAIPAALLMVWSEGVDWAARYYWDVSPNAPDWRSMLLYAGGAIAVFTLAPFMMVRIWSTSSLGESSLRTRLREMCKLYRVRLRDVRVWHTRGSMINGAVLGVVPVSRYILLTDALLESMPQEQVEAVMAHEIAHVRNAHLHWLGAAALSCFLLAGAAAAQGAWWLVGGAGASELVEDLAAWTGMAVGMAATVLVFGYVSRRFERQADAFAASHLSGETPVEDAMTEAPVVTRSSARVMIETLGNVAALNHIPRTRFSLRHGSIAQRQQQLEDAIGRPLNRLPIDREVGLIKAAIVVAGVLAVGLLVFFG